MWRLPRLTARQLEDLEAAGIEAVEAIPDAFPISSAQRRYMQACRSGGFLVQSGLQAALAPLGAGCAYLDFETFNPAIPIYPGTRPYQRIPVQWSLHRRAREDADVFEHEEFLAPFNGDPRRAFAETLIRSTEFPNPLFVYSPFERSVIEDLRDLFPEHDRALAGLQERLVDLLPTVRDFVDHPRFQGSKSIKTVAPVFASHVDYESLEGVADGSDASAAIYRLATGELMAGETETGLRQRLLQYCALDTLALAHVHAGMVALAVGGENSA